MRYNKHITVIIPARNEQAAIGAVVDSIPSWVDDIVVADNGSTDNTAEIARESGAHVVTVQERGYGSACLGAMATVQDTDIVVFMDGDGSDNTQEMQHLTDPLIHGGVDVVIGSRVLGEVESGAMTRAQRWGNALACTLIRWRYGVIYTDLGPFRAIGWQTLKELQMCDPDYGWTVELQLRAIASNLHVREVPVSYRRRIGVSKISGTVRGVIGAGSKIIWLIARSAVSADGLQPGQYDTEANRRGVPRQAR